MSDAVMGLIVLSFFFLCVGYVAWCGRILGPDPDELPMGSPTSEITTSTTTDEAAVAARR